MRRGRDSNVELCKFNLFENACMRALIMWIQVCRNTAMATSSYASFVFVFEKVCIVTRVCLNATMATSSYASFVFVFENVCVVTVTNVVPAFLRSTIAVSSSATFIFLFL